MEQMTATGVVECADSAETAYAMWIDWDPDDRIFVVTVPELPGCMTHGETRTEAVRKGELAIASWLAAARHWGTPIPTPRAVQHEASAGPDRLTSGNSAST
jgi:predicted RNase H-like HicB family nuclease